MLQRYSQIAQLAQHYKKQNKSLQIPVSLPMKKPNPKTQFQKLLQSNYVSQTSHKFPQDTNIPYYKYIKCSTKDTTKLKKYISNKYYQTIPQSKTSLQIKQVSNNNFIIHCLQKHYIRCPNCCNFYIRYQYDNGQKMFVLLEYQNVHVHYQMSVNMNDVQLLARRLRIKKRNKRGNGARMLRSYNKNDKPGFEDQLQHEFEEERQ